MNLNHVVKLASTSVVGVIAAYVSWWHMHDLVQAAGERHGAPLIIPFSVDGMMLVATSTMIEDRRAGRQVRRAAWVALAVGMAVSLAANTSSASGHGVLGRLVAAWPAVALALVIELVARRGRKDTAAKADTSVLTDAELTALAKPRRGRPAAETLAMAQQVWARNPTLTRADVARQLGISDGRLAEVMRRTNTTTH